MTQTASFADNLVTVLQGLFVLAYTWGLPALAAILVMAGWQRSKVRYHVGNPKVGVPVQTFRTKAAARKAAIELYRTHRKSFRITTTR